MTAEQQQSLTNAMAGYVAAEAAFTNAQQVAQNAAALANEAHVNATVTVPQANAAAQTAANAAFFTAQDAQQKAIAAALQATADLGTAQIALNQAISDSRQTGAVEKVAGQTTTY